MDIGLYVAVLRRHRLALVVGLAVAILLAVLASFRVSLSPPKLTLKLLPTYSTTSQILVTQAGAPTSRVTLTPERGPRDQAGQVISPFGDPDSVRIPRPAVRPARQQLRHQAQGARQGRLPAQQPARAERREDRRDVHRGPVHDGHGLAADHLDRVLLHLRDCVERDRRACDGSSPELPRVDAARCLGSGEEPCSARRRHPSEHREAREGPAGDHASRACSCSCCSQPASSCSSSRTSGATLSSQRSAGRFVEEMPTDIRSVDPPAVDAPAPLRRESRRERAARAAVVESVPRPRPRTLARDARLAHHARHAWESSAMAAGGGSAVGAEARDGLAHRSPWWAQCSTGSRVTRPSSRSPRRR